MDLFIGSDSDPSSPHPYTRRSHRLRNIRHRRRVVSDHMDVDLNVNVESTSDEAHDVVMQEANEDDSSNSMNDDNSENDEVENVLVGNSNEEFQIDDEENAEQFEIDNDEHADEDYEEDLQEPYEGPDRNVNEDDDDSIDDDQSHFP
ncbi:hypothetical protein GGU10DRAFT_382071 [Lentinula aff. detonsa]|uniref:Uncharacterized protein n=1 Tax=Lentinula aff. detonsa TaxID=2804958 RepID=A0AA38KKL8_9AGAR|nr:hypothetical protein GGU10DRAFT_382071 [Lentinula aff. detonsa]